MEMVSRGEVTLDAPIEIYLPGLKLPEKEGKKITLRHLAMHTSGLPRMPTNFDPQNLSNPYEDYSVDKLYEFLAGCTLQTVPGETSDYSNVGMGLLAYILTLKADKSYEQLITDTISTKLSMTNTTISLTPEMEPLFAKGHDSRQIVDHWDLTPVFEGAGAVRSSVKDMTQFLAANMGLINSPVTDLLQKCHKPQGVFCQNMDIGLGWIISHAEGSDIICHDGGTGGFRTFIGFNPTAQRGVVVFSNSTGDWPSTLGMTLLDPEAR